jgi:hypothetical protein
MKSAQDRNYLDYAMEVLDPSLLDKLAANILLFTPAELELISFEQADITPSGGANDGV